MDTFYDLFEKSESELKSFLSDELKVTCQNDIEYLCKSMKDLKEYCMIVFQFIHLILNEFFSFQTIRMNLIKKLHPHSAILVSHLTATI